MTSPSDSRFVMGFPSLKQNQQVPPPGYAMPFHPGPYPPPPSPTQPAGYINGGYMGPSASKTYVSPSFNGGYMSSRNYGPMAWVARDEEDSGKKFGRVMLVTMVTLIVSMCMVSLMIWFLFGMEVPEFHVSTLSVSNLNVSDSLIAASWDANVTVFNPNSDVRIDFEHVRVSIFYKNFPLGMSSIEPFYLQGTRMHNLPLMLDNQTALLKPVLSEEMIADQNNGFFFVSLRISLGAKFASNSIWRKETLRVFCEDLKLNLAPQGGMGTLAEDAQSECLIFT